MKTASVTDSCVEESMQGQDKLLSEGKALTKKCPFCAEQIPAEAIKCRYCGEFLDGSSRSKPRPGGSRWYFATGTVVMALLCLGPLALPLVWLNPRYKPATKAIISLVVLVGTVLCIYLMGFAYKQVLDQFQTLGM